MSDSDISPLDRLQQRLAYSFRDRALLVLALTHPSYLQDHTHLTESNQRLEFLGDAVLQLVLTEALFTQFPAEREGSLSKRRSALSKGKFLSDLARDYGLPDCILVGASEKVSGGSQRDGALEDALEALIGALYLDSDLATTRRILLGMLGPIAEKLAAIEPAENPKGQLQELIQGEHGNHALRYSVTHVAGQDHEREYEAVLFFNEALIGKGRGPSKKSAEEAAAREGLLSLSPRA